MQAKADAMQAYVMHSLSLGNGRCLFMVEPTLPSPLPSLARRCLVVVALLRMPPVLSCLVVALLRMPPVLSSRRRTPPHATCVVFSSSHSSACHMCYLLVVALLRMPPFSLPSPPPPPPPSLPSSAGSTGICINRSIPCIQNMKLRCLFGSQGVHNMHSTRDVHDMHGTRDVHGSALGFPPQVSSP